MTSGTTGGWEPLDAGTGETEISPVAEATPLDTTYCSVTGPDSTPIAETCTSSWSCTATRRPSGVVTDTSTSTPPAGSESLASGATVTSPPAGSQARSYTATGTCASVLCSRTSIRASPVACCGAAVTVKLT